MVEQRMSKPSLREGLRGGAESRHASASGPRIRAFDATTGGMRAKVDAPSPHRPVAPWPHFAEAVLAERDASTPERFERLIPMIRELIELVDQHDPRVRRSVFDAYVTAIVARGATLRELRDLHGHLVAHRDHRSVDGPIDA